MTKIVTAVLPLALLIFCFSVAGPAGSLRAATAAEDSTGAAPQYGDVNRDFSIDIFDLLAILRQISGSEPATAHSDLDANGKTNIFDLLAILRLLGDMREPLEVAATVGGHWLTEPMVYSYSQSWDSTGVRDWYHIYSSREIDRAKFILDGDTVKGITGTTPVLFAADPDTVKIEPSGDYRAFSEPKTWKITVWDKLGNCASDSGVSQFVVVYPGITGFHGGSNSIGEEIKFPLTLHGTVQRFGIKVFQQRYGSYTTFVVDLNPEGREIEIYAHIKQLADQIMDQVASNDSLWPFLNIFGEPALLVSSAAISKQNQEITDRLLIYTDRETGIARLVSLDGNTNLITQLGFKKWVQDIQSTTYDGNFELDPEILERYRGW
jgi:dockerin type I repeat protein